MRTLITLVIAVWSFVALAQTRAPEVVTTYGDSQSQSQSPNLSTTVTLKDISGADSPVKFSGSIIMTLTQNPDTDRLDESPTITMVNTSQKTLLGLVGWITSTDPHGGAGFSVRYYHEFFFKEVGFAPGESMDVATPAENKQSKVVGHAAAAVRPHAEGKLLFAQFADGTTWGDPLVAGDFLRERAEVHQMLQTLASTYDAQGEAALLAELAKSRDPESTAGALLLSLRYMAANSGTAVVVENIKKRIAVADARKAQ